MEASEMGRGMWNRRGIAPVVSSIIMCAVVLVIGASIWGVASSASSVLRSDYFEEVMESVEKIKERFCIENIGFDNTSQPTLKIWIVNYGKINTTIEWIRIRGGGDVSSHEFNTPISPGEMVRFDVAPTEVSLASGLSITVEVKSTRGNKAYDSILMP